MQFPKEFKIIEGMDPYSISIIPDLHAATSNILYPVVHWKTPTDGSVSTDIDSAKEFVLYMYSKKIEIKHKEVGFPTIMDVLTDVSIVNGTETDLYAFCIAIGRWK